MFVLLPISFANNDEYVTVAASIVYLCVVFVLLSAVTMDEVSEVHECFKFTEEKLSLWVKTLS